jgi:hypothetical protein
MRDEPMTTAVADAVRDAFSVQVADILGRVEVAVMAQARSARPPVAAVVPLRPRALRTVARVAACLLVVVLAVPTATAATASSLPGDTWHPVQAGLERLWVTVAPGGAASARVELRLAVRRLDAVERAAAIGRHDAIATLLATFDSHLDAAEQLGGAAVAAEVDALRRVGASLRARYAADGWSGAAAPGRLLRPLASPEASRRPSPVQEANPAPPPAARPAPAGTSAPPAAVPPPAPASLELPAPVGTPGPVEAEQPAEPAEPAPAAQPAAPEDDVHDVEEVDDEADEADEADDEDDEDDADEGD